MQREAKINQTGNNAGIVSAHLPGTSRPSEKKSCLDKTFIIKYCLVWNILGLSNRKKESLQSYFWYQNTIKHDKDDKKFCFHTFCSLPVMCVIVKNAKDFKKRKTNTTKNTGLWNMWKHVKRNTKQIETSTRKSTLVHCQTCTVCIHDIDTIIPQNTCSKTRYLKLWLSVA